MADFKIDIAGTIAAIIPQNCAAAEWFDLNVVSDSWQWSYGVCMVDHRYVDDIRYIIEAEGYTIESETA